MNIENYYVLFDANDLIFQLTDSVPLEKYDKGYKDCNCCSKPSQKMKNW